MASQKSILFLLSTRTLVQRSAVGPLTSMPQSTRRAPCSPPSLRTSAAHSPSLAASFTLPTAATGATATLIMAGSWVFHSTTPLVSRPGLLRLPAVVHGAPAESPATVLTPSSPRATPLLLQFG